MVKEKTWFEGTAQNLEKLKIIHLDPEDIAEQLYEQKVRTFLLMIYITYYITYYLNISKMWFEFTVFEYSYEQILAVEILQHRFNIEKMVKIAEILLTYSDEGEEGTLQVFFTY